jgi:hypothetical protein
VRVAVKACYARPPLLTGSEMAAMSSGGPRRNVMIRISVAAVVGFLITGCGGDRFCGWGGEVAGIWMYVTDRATGAPLQEVRGQARSGVFTDSLRNIGSTDAPVYVAVYGAQHRGVFAIHLERQGYVARDLSNVMVTGNDCDLNSTVLHVTLDPAQ